MKLTPQMELVIAAIAAGGHMIEPEGGGFWRTPEGGRLDFPNMTQTVYSLAKRNILKRTAKHREPWRDTYVLADWRL